MRGLDHAKGKCVEIGGIRLFHGRIRQAVEDRNELNGTGTDSNSFTLGEKTLLLAKFVDVSQSINSFVVRQTDEHIGIQSSNRLGISDLCQRAKQSIVSDGSTLPHFVE